MYRWHWKFTCVTCTGLHLQWRKVKQWKRIRETREDKSLHLHTQWHEERVREGKQRTEAMKEVRMSKWWNLESKDTHREKSSVIELKRWWVSNLNCSSLHSKSSIESCPLSLSLSFLLSSRVTCHPVCHTQNEIQEALVKWISYKVVMREGFSRLSSLPHQKDSPLPTI